MNIQKNGMAFLLGLLVLAEFAIAAPVIREASFHRVFDNREYYAAGEDLSLKLSTMSGDGKVVAFYGNDSSGKNRRLFIHNFESTADPVEVTLPASIGNFNTNAGLVSNADGSRIFFTAHQVDDGSINLFCRVNGLTGVVTVLLSANQTDVEYPQDIATDAVGAYLYFNESDNGDSGDLWRIQASGGAIPELVIQAGAVPHPSGGVGRFVDQFDISDDGSTIAFFIEGRIDGGTTTRTDKELFVKTSGIRNLTNNTLDSKDDLVLSGDGSTIVYGEKNKWMVTTPDAAVGSERHIETDYINCGDRPGITKSGNMIFACSNPIGASSASAYLIKTDGSSRLMVEPAHISMLATSEGFHLSNDGTRVFFKNYSYVYPDKWYNMTAGVFGPNLWPDQVPKVTNVSYPADLYTKLENNKYFEIRITVSDPQDIITDDRRVRELILFPSGYEAKGAGTVSLYMNDESEADNLYTARGAQGSAWPARIPVMTARFSVEDDDGNVGYTDTLVQPPISVIPVINYLLMD